MIEIQFTLKHHFHMDEKLFKLFCIENYLNISQNATIYLFKYFALHITLIPRNDTFLYYMTKQIPLRCIILQNSFLASE